jgi:HSP20 family protein
MRKRDDIGRLNEEIQELVDELWRVPRFSGARRVFRPQVDCVRSEDPPALHVMVELPGVDPAAIQVVAADRLLVVAGERRRPPLRGRYQQREIDYGPFLRRIPLAEPVDTGAATAHFEKGVLTVELPVVAQPAPRERVTIVIGGRV